MNKITRCGISLLIVISLLCCLSGHHCALGL